MKLHEILKNRKRNYSKSQKKVINFIENNVDDALFLNSANLARRVGVSQSTVIRLTQELGFRGYPEFQEKLREGYQNGMSTISRLEKTVKSMHEGDDVLYQVLDQEIHNISQAMMEIPRETFWSAVNDLISASKIYVIGLSGAHAAALTLVTNLRFIRKEVQLLKPGYGEMWDIVRDISEHDLVIGISFPRYTRLTVKVLEKAKSNNVRIGVITDSMISPIAKYADWVLMARYKLESIVESFVVPISIINALLTAVITKEPDKSLHSLEVIEKLWRDEEFYV